MLLSEKRRLKKATKTETTQNLQSDSNDYAFVLSRFVAQDYVIFVIGSLSYRIH